MNAQFKLNNGAITLYIDGKPVPFTTYKSTESTNDQRFAETVQRSVADMSARGVHVHFVPIFFDWPAVGKYDFSRMDWRVAQVLAADPQAWVVIRIQAVSMAPKWWMDANPDGVLQLGFGRGVELPRMPNQALPAPSLGSTFWEDAGIPALQALAAHVLAQPYCPRVIGYLPTSYNTNEWFLRSYDPLQVNDLCPAMQRSFQRFLSEEYGLQGDYPVPDRADRHLADEGFLFNPDPRQSRAPVTAYYRYVNQRMAETIIQACAALRAAHAPDRIIVGTFYGYSLELAQMCWLADSGHLDYQRLLQADGPDFTCSPLAYYTRDPHDLPGGGFNWSLSTAVDSARASGKAYFGEDDLGPMSAAGMTMWAPTGSQSEDAEMLRRNFIFTLCKGQLQWWYDLGGHYFDEQYRLDVVAQCTPIAAEALQRDRSTVSQVAVVIDEKAPMLVQLDLDSQRTLFWENFFHSFARIGAPVDLFMLSDLAHTDLSRYKAIFFPTCFSLTQADRQRIERLKADGRTLVFYHADGYLNPEAKPVFDVQHMADLTGIKILTAMGYGHGFWRLSASDSHPLVKGMEDLPFGRGGERLLSFYVKDAAAETIAHHNGRGAAGMVRRLFPTWTSIYCAIPVIPPELVRNIITSAGVHLYTSDPGDIIYACAAYVGVYTRAGGRKTLHLPGARLVKERMHAAITTHSPVNEVSWEAAGYTSYLFELTE